MSNFQVGLIKLDKLILIPNNNISGTIYDYNSKQTDKYRKIKQEWFKPL